jgi:hypothetical protein
MSPSCPAISDRPVLGAAAATDREFAYRFSRSLCDPGNHLGARLIYITAN